MTYNYSAFTLLAMQSAIIVCAVRPSVRLSVTFRCFVQTNRYTIVWSSGRTIILVSEDVKFIYGYSQIAPGEGVKVGHSPVASENLTNNQP